MTAGGGIFHEEMFETDGASVNASANTSADGLQIWFNLPAARKRQTPGYRPAHATDIPEITLEGGATARIVAGELEGKRGAFTGIAVNPTYLDVRLPAGATVTLPAPQGETTFAYLYRGAAHFGPNHDHQEATAAQLVIFCDGDAAQITANAEAEARFIFVSACPLHEPVLQYRSLVMNTVEEMQQAIADLKNGTFEAR
jgi:hypothetical protein